MASEELGEDLAAAYDLIDELWPKIAERWKDDPVGRLRHVIEANLDHQGPKPKPRPRPTGEVQTFFKGGKK